MPVGSFGQFDHTLIQPRRNVTVHVATQPRRSQFALLKY